jgi:integrase
MASVKWKLDKRPGRKPVLVVDWNDPLAPGGRVERRCPELRTKAQGMEYGLEKERLARRIAEGLELAPSRVTLGDIWDRWWKGKGSRRRAKSNEYRGRWLDMHFSRLRPFVLVPATAGAFADAVESVLQGKEDLRKQRKKGGLSPTSINHLRGELHAMIEYARDPKIGLWHGENPIHWVKPRKRVRSPRVLLRAEQVAPVLAALKGVWRSGAALCLYLALRPGEAFALRKSDIDQVNWTAWIHRSWEADLTKTEEDRTIIIPPEAREFVARAIEASPIDHLLFRQDGEPFREGANKVLLKHLRRALCAIGDVIGWDHTCRRCKSKAKKTGEAIEFEWRHPDGAQRTCPACGMKLWASADPRPITAYSLRHSTATILRKRKVDLGTVSKMLGHASPDTTRRFYDHSELEDFRPELEAGLAFATPRPPRAPDAMETGAPGAPGALEAPERASMFSATYNPVRSVNPGAMAHGVVRDQGVAGSNPVSPTPEGRGTPRETGDAAAFDFPESGSRPPRAPGRPGEPLPPPTADMFITAGAIVAERAARGAAPRSAVEEILRRAVNQAAALRGAA